MLLRINLNRLALAALIAWLEVAVAGNAFAASADWNLNANGNWGDAGSWTAGGPPNGVDEIAQFLNNISGTRTITLDISPTIGTMNVADSNNTHAFIIAGSNALVFDVSAGTAAINKADAANTRTDTISAPITLKDNLVITNAATSSNGRLILSGPIDDLGGAKSIEKLGAGRVELTGSNTFSGGVIITAGSLTVNGTSTNPTSGAVASGPLGTGSVTLNGGTFVPTSNVSVTIANNFVLNNVAGNSIAVGGGPAMLTGNMTGSGGFSKGSSGTLVLSGANSYAGPTTATSGILEFAKTQSLYNGNTAQWTDTNLIAGSGGAVVFAVGGPGFGEFTMADFFNFAAMGTATTGFTDGSSIGIDTTNSGDQTISTVFTNNNSGMNKLGLVKAGVNTLFLTAANTHGGPTTVTGGTLNLSNELALQNSTLTMSTGTVSFDQSVASNAFTLGGLAGTTSLVLSNTANVPIALTVGGNNLSTVYSGNLASTASGSSITKVGTGALTLAGNNAYDGATTISAGTLNINNASAIGFGPLIIQSGATIDNTTTANIVNANNNVQTWNGNFTFAGTRALNLGTGAVTMAGNTVISTPGINGNNNALSVGGSISGPGLSLTKSGTGRMFLTGQSTFDGGFTITGGGPVHVGDQSSNFSGGTGPLGIGTVHLSGGQLIGSSTVGVFNTLENNIELTGGPDVNFITTNGTMTLSGIISGSGGFDKTGNTASVVTLTAANTFTGNTTVDSPTSGTLNLANELALQNSTLASGNVVFDAIVGSNAFKLGGLSGGGNLTLANSSSLPITLSVGNNNTNTTHTGSLSGAGSLVKIGSGVLTLAPTTSNSYTGTTTVSAGTLLVNGAHSGAGAYSVASGATLGGTGSIGASVDVSAGGVIAGGAAGAGGLTVGSANIDGTMLVQYNGDNSTVGSLLTAGTLDITSATVDFANLGSAALTAGTYVIATYGTLVGNGADNAFMSVLDLPAGFNLDYHFGGNQIALISAGLAGDFDSDGDVDGADFIAWQTHFPTNGGATLAMGDGNGDGNVNGADFALWQTSFPTSPSATAVVPEPSSVLLAGLSALGLCLYARRQRK